MAKGLYEKKSELSGAWNFGPHNESFVTVQTLVDEAIKNLGKGEHKITPDSSKHEAHILKLDINKADSLLGWKPTLSLKQNLDMTFDWYKNYYEKREDVVEFTNKQIKNFFKLN